MRIKRLKAGSITILFVVGLLYQSIASAGLLRLAPVRVFLDERTRTAVVQLTNPGDSPIGVQVDAFDWNQGQDGSDQYEPTSEIVAFPPIFTIPPGETQLVRIGQLMPSPAEIEATYRVYFTELPQANAVDDTTASLKMRLRIGVPVFSASLAPKRPSLRFVESEYREDGLRIQLENTGNTHLRISELLAAELIDAESVTAATYILPGATQEFIIPVPAGAVIATVHAISEQLGITEFDLETGQAVILADAELASR
jgi:fimbrial chaperone protein